MAISADYENPWTFEDNTFRSEDIGDYKGFVYMITNNITGEKYIGRKYFESHRKKKGAKRKSTSESDWKKYYGSSDYLKKSVKELGKENFKREIISLHKKTGDTNYSETKTLFSFDVLEKEGFINENILGRYFRNSIDISGRKISRKFVNEFVNSKSK
jgi:hypothetical protein